MTRRTIPWAIAAALLLGAGCGDDDNNEESEGSDEAPAAETAAGDSEYCEVAVDWAIHEMTPFDDTDPVAFRAYWDTYTTFTGDALTAAPEEIASDWQLKVEWESGLTRILEKYDFDGAAMQAQGTPEEAAAFEAPEDAAAAQDRILTYESEVCGAQQPQPADVSYDGEEPGSYCELVAAQDEMAAEALASGDPDQLEAAFSELEAGADALVDAAPDAIKDDVADLTAWTSQRQEPVAEEYGWDFAAAMREGTIQQRLDLNRADAGIRDQFARVIAYEEQVCGA